MSTRLRASISLTLLALVASAVVAAGTLTLTPAARRPLPLEQAVTLEMYRAYALSPDGKWLAYSIDNGEGGGYRLRLEELATGKTEQLSTVRISSAFPYWSPDGRRLLYFSEDQGPPALWTWERDSRQASPVAAAAGLGVGLNSGRWFSDSARLLLPLRPEGEAPPPQDVAERAESFYRPPFAAVSADEPAVFVLRANMSRAAPEPRASARAVARQGCKYLIHSPCDLAIIDLRDGRVTRLATRTHIAWFYGPSPDGRSVAYTVFTGIDPRNSDQLFELRVVDLGSMQTRTLAQGLRAWGGGGLRWSPDSRALAYAGMTVGPVSESASEDRLKRGEGELVVVPVNGGGARVLKRASLPAFDVRKAPFWDASSRALYAISLTGELWKIDARSGAGRRVASVPDSAITQIASADGLTPYVSKESREIVVSAARRDGSAAGVYSVSPKRGATHALIVGPQRITASTFQASAPTDSVTFIASDLQHVGNIWRVDLEHPQLVELGHGPSRQSDYALGNARLVHWKSAAGESLSGALLLPPDYVPGERLPLVVSVYGGELGSQNINRFALGGNATFNFHVLASRGYAVLTPDAPLRVGRPLQDLYDTVLPGVDAVVAQGFADPERLAVMGHSYGAYCAIALITHTARFKAAIVSGVLDPDLMSGYLYMAPTGVSRELSYESGQVRMGGTPWQYPERYRENSPIYDFDKIETPVLIAQGEIDGAAPRGGADKVFVALRRLAKPVEYRIYEEEGHELRRRANLVDFWQRRLAFLAEHLHLTVDEQGRIIRPDDSAGSSSTSQ
jgi:dipeptidyl aminopeptidase/acylaminoacyl peptidase